MKKRARVVWAMLLVGVFAVSGGMLINELVQYRRGAETYAEAETLADLPDLSALGPALPEPDPAASPSEETPAPYVDPYAQQLRSMDFTALREVNEEVLGWILIPGTAVSYPLLQGRDNTYYLNHTWKKWSSVVGSIFLEETNRGDFSDFNTIVYGHNMNNGSMFGSLKRYRKHSYWQAHPAVYITDDSGSRRYDIFAAYEIDTQGGCYRVGLTSDEGKQTFLDECLEASVIDTGVIPTVYDRILTLSTCTGRGHATRWVVQARLEGEPPATSVPDAAPEEPVS